MPGDATFPRAGIAGARLSLIPADLERRRIPGDELARDPPPGVDRIGLPVVEREVAGDGEGEDPCALAGALAVGASTTNSLPRSLHPRAATSETLL